MQLFIEKNKIKCKILPKFDYIATHFKLWVQDKKEIVDFDLVNRFDLSYEAAKCFVELLTKYYLLVKETQEEPSCLGIDAKALTVIIYKTTQDLYEILDDELLSILKEVEKADKIDAMEKICSYCDVDIDFKILNKLGISDPIILLVLKWLTSNENNGTVSITGIQRRFGISYNRAGQLIDYMEKKDYVSELDENKMRRVLINGNRSRWSF